jgi:putative holliday junction resolvase
MGMRILALDIGDKRIGLALSDPSGIIATPLKILERSDDERDISSIAEIIGRNEVGLIIAGLPLSYDGGVGPQALKVKTFVGKLQPRTYVPIEYRDESLTTNEAREIMLTSRSKKKRQKSHDDDVAAAVLLQNYLEEKRTADESSNIPTEKDRPED